MIFLQFTVFSLKMEIQITPGFNEQKILLLRIRTNCYIFVINVIGICMHFLFLYDSNSIETGGFIFLCIIFTIVYCIWRNFEQHRRKSLYLFNIFNTIILAFMIFIIYYWHNLFFMKHDILTYIYNLDITIYIVFCTVILRLIAAVYMKKYNENGSICYKKNIYFVLMCCLYAAIVLLLLISPFMMNLSNFYLFELLWICLRISAILLFSNLLIKDLLYPVHEDIKINYLYFIGQLYVILLFMNRTFYVPDQIMLEKTYWYEWVKTKFLEN